MYACMYVYDIYYKCAVRSYLLMLCWHKLFYQSQFRIPSFGMRTTRWPDLQVWFWCLKVFWFWEKRFAAWVISSVQSVLVPLLSLSWGPRCMTSITCCVMVHKLKRVTVLLVIFLVISPTFDFFFYSILLPCFHQQRGKWLSEPVSCSFGSASLKCLHEPSPITHILHQLAISLFKNYLLCFLSNILQRQF